MHIRAKSSDASSRRYRPVARRIPAVRVEDVVLSGDLLIAGGSLVCIKDGRDLELRVEHGSVWITLEGSTQDVVLEVGNRIQIPHDGVTLISSCGVRTSFALVTIARSAPISPPKHNRIPERLWNWWAGSCAGTTPRLYL